MKGLVAAELFKLSRRRMAWVLLALVPALIAVIYVLLFTALASRESGASDSSNLEASLAFRNVITFGDSTVFRVVSIVAIILAGATTAAEFQWRTVITLCTWTGDRRRLVVSRLAAFGLCVAVALVAGYVAVVAASVVGNAARGALAADDIGPRVASDALLAAGRAWLLVMVYVTFAVMVGVLSRSTAAAVALPLFVLLIEPFGAAAFDALGGPLSVAKEFTLTHNIDGVLAADGPVAGTDGAAGGYPSALRGAAFLATFTAITAWIAIAAFTRRDIEQ